MSKNINVGDIIGIYEVLSTDTNKLKDGHKQIRVKCTVCGLERDIRPINLGATTCTHKRIIEPRYCKCCGEIIPYTDKTKSANYKLRTFCSSSCAAKINGKRPHSEESRVKASMTQSAKRAKNTKLCKDELLNKYNITLDNKISIKNASKYYEAALIAGLDYVICPYCNLRFSQIQQGHLALHNKTLNDLYNDFGNDYKVISDKSYTKRATAGKAAQQKLIENGTHRGWLSRNISSYAEQFWITVLNNNKISYEREFLINCNNTHYFLDFKIKQNDKLVDLEIDGKQHNYTERAKSDAIRDERLRQLGYIVYRVPWNEINTEDGKQEMQRKINDFLEFYSAL